ncbi:MAG: hypothetical protein KAR42_06750 [candidate division Zixibacteria bacterium]|nr:hypothetical protein [candidate division Zixibacteria bacterium]
MIGKLMPVLLLCLLIAAGAAAETLTKKTDRGYVSESYTLTSSIKTEGTLIINAAGSLSGLLKIKAEGNECRVKYRKLLKADSKDEANEYAGSITVECSPQQNNALLTLRAPARAPWSGTSNSARLEVTISVPPMTKLEINTAYFDIAASGPFAGCVVSESLSKVTVDNVTGDVEIKVSSRPVSLKKITGRLVVSNKYGKIRLQNIDATDKMATIRNEQDTIIINSFIGSADISTSYSDIIAENMTFLGDRNRIKNISAPIILGLDSLTSGRLKVYNQYGMIKLNINGPVDAAFNCKISEEGAIDTKGMEMEPTLVYDDRLEFDVGNGTAEVRLSAKHNGNIIIKGPNSNTDTGGN